MRMDPLQLAMTLLLLVKTGEPAEEIVAQLAALPPTTLSAALDTDARKKAFWVNCYNAYFQLLATEKHLEKPAIFQDRVLTIAGVALSLDDIEHGILRKHRYKWSLGYLPDPFASRTIRHWAVSERDYRIHFALNCGAKSCPPIAFYDADKIDAQLDLATLSFLEGETEVFPEKKEIHTTRLFQWFKGDFGGGKGIRRILHAHLGIETKGWKVVFTSYDWEEQLGYYRSL